MHFVGEGKPFDHQRQQADRYSAYYPDWFCNRLREGFVCVRNPMNFHQVGRIALSLDVVDGIVFWTKIRGR